MELMRVEVTAANVHTSEGKLLRGLRVTLPREEADQLIARGLAKGVPGRRPEADEPREAVVLDLGAGEVGGVEPDEELALQMELDEYDTGESQ